VVEKLARAEVGAMTERRALARHKTFIKGRIYFNNRLSSVDCIVRDLADIGARLEIPENVTLPDSFELYLPTKDEHFQARVKWRKGNNLGIAWGAESARSATETAGSDASVIERLTKLEREVAILQRRLTALQDK
jgi:PilZ domain